MLLLLALSIPLHMFDLRRAAIAKKCDPFSVVAFCATVYLKRSGVFT